MEPTTTPPTIGVGPQISLQKDLFMINAPLQIVTIKRTHHLPTETFGVIDIDGDPSFLSVELPWKNNQSNVSRIPAGEYMTERFYSPTFLTDVFKVVGVPNRSDIEIHISNDGSTLRGCIAIGREFGKINGRDAVLFSRTAFFDFMGRFKDVDKFRLVVQDL